MLMQFDFHAFLLSSTSAQAMILTIMLVRLVHRKQSQLQYICNVFSTGLTSAILGLSSWFSHFSWPY